MYKQTYLKYLKKNKDLKSMNLELILLRTKNLKKDLLLHFRKIKMRQYFETNRMQINEKQKIKMKIIYHGNDIYRKNKIKSSLDRYNLNKCLTRTYTKSDNTPYRTELNETSCMEFLIINK